MPTPDHDPATNTNARSPAWFNQGFRFGEWTVIPTENCLRRDDRRVRLEPKVMQLLLALVARHGKPCTRNELLDQFWPSTDTGESSLTRAISELRKALGDQRSPARYIDTIQRVGYKALAPIQPLPTALGSTDESGPGRALSRAEEVIAMSRYLLVRRNSKDIRQAMDVLEAHLAAHAGHAQAWAMLAHARALLTLYADEPPALHERKAGECARRSLDLDGANGLAWAVLGGLAHTRWRWAEALDQYERAHAFQPLDPIILHGFAELLLHLGRIEPAKAMMRQACRLQPTAASAHLVLGWMLLHGEERQARQELSKARQLGARTRFCDNLECLLFNREGWTDASVRRWKELDEVRTGHPRWLWPDYLIDGLIDKRAARAAATTIRERVLLGQLEPGIAPFMLTLAGALDAAFELADIAIERRRFFVIDPWLAEMTPFREDPRFATVLDKVGLTMPPAA